MRVLVKVKRIDKGRKRFQNLLRSVRDDQSFVKVGLLGTKKAARSGEKLTNAQVAIANEFGTSRIPARPFIGPAFRANQESYKATLAALVTRLVRTGDRSFTDVLNMLGSKVAADFKNFVTQGDAISPPNAPSTIARKLRRDMDVWKRNGRRKPGSIKEGPVMAPRTLIDTGRMVGAITWQVVPLSSLGLANRLSASARRVALMPKLKVNKYSKLTKRAKK